MTNFALIFVVLMCANKFGMIQMAIIKNETLVPRDRFGITEILEGDIMVRRRPLTECVSILTYENRKFIL